MTPSIKQRSLLFPSGDSARVRGEDLSRGRWSLHLCRLTTSHQRLLKAISGAWESSSSREPPLEEMLSSRRALQAQVAMIPTIKQALSPSHRSQLKVDTNPQKNLILQDQAPTINHLLTRDLLQNSGLARALRESQSKRL